MEGTNYIDHRFPCKDKRVYYVQMHYMDIVLGYEKDIATVRVQ